MLLPTNVAQSALSQKNKLTLIDKPIKNELNSIALILKGNKD